MGWQKCSGIRRSYLAAFGELLTCAWRAFTELDLSLLEINPLVIRTDGGLMCADAKINVDDNSLYRQPALYAMRDESQEDVRERAAAVLDLNYVALEGNIGCMVNGAGLAMATMDIIKLYGGEPANFLDVGGGATQERVTEAFKLICADTRVGGILVNIFGGIVRCDMIAKAIIDALLQEKITLPVVARLSGNHAAEGMRLLRESGMAIVPVDTLDEAARAIIEIVK